jgi:signal recognition particle subunit SRP19
MSRHARIEEVSDSDSDPDIMDPSAFASPSSALIDPANIPSTTTQAQPPRRQYDPSKSKRWTCLYPIYFDAAKTRAEGRRVGKEQAVENPLARTIAAAVAEQGLNVVFEPGKIHPKDWANPGRVKIELKSEDGKLKRPHVKNSMWYMNISKIMILIDAEHHLYIFVSKYLKSHPTTPETPLELPIQGMPLPDKPMEPPAVPRGWKLNTILPLHSPAASGGGVSENFLKDMMAEMQGGPAGALGAPSSSGGGSKKKEKKKGKP